MLVKVLDAEKCVAFFAIQKGICCFAVSLEKHLLVL